MVRRRWMAAGIALIAASTAVAGPAVAAERPGGVALPWGSATATWTSTSPAPGVEVRTASISVPQAQPVWTVTVQAPAVNRMTGAAAWAELGDAAWAATSVSRLAAAGIDAHVDQVPWPAFTDTPHGTEGSRVRVGGFATQADAKKQADAVTAAGLHPLVEWTGYDVDQAPDRESVHVGIVDPTVFHGRVVADHGGAVAGRSTTSAQARAAGSVLAVNAGFFITADADGVQGTQAGLGVYGGVLDAQSSGGRAALILQDGGRHSRVANLTSRATVRDGASSYPINGTNRVPGRIRDCGRPGVSPTEQPRQDFTCTSADDLVSFTPHYGADLPTGAGAQAVLDGRGRVVAAGTVGGRVPAGGEVLQGIGTAATWLKAHAVVGRRLTVDERVRDSAGRTVPLTGRTGIASAGPILLRDGKVAIDAAAEGVVDPADLSFGYAWAEQRQPRTLAGTDAWGRLILVTVDGRQPGVSEGATLEEAARLMRGLGAVNALNLDGGGSTAMAVDGTVVNKPSDATGERAVGDTVQVIP
ncbi:phosphodiester glycosidase family protein [Actinoallomurus sp. CA-142502]|uniref:phosphodiester glycosidase family protein n=1 Tax=Actinoallomurus sp. CA-142502 TaxID=3239885 RepID=UPI003D91B942